MKNQLILFSSKISLLLRKLKLWRKCDSFSYRNWHQQWYQQLALDTTHAKSRVHYVLPFQPHASIEALTVYLQDFEGVDHIVWQMKNTHVDFWEIGQVELDFTNKKSRVRKKGLQFLQEC